jgi:hypothetical protein
MSTEGREEPLAQVTFTVREGKEETINLFKGDDMERILDKFCRKYHIRRNIREVLEDELVSQLKENGVDLSLLSCEEESNRDENVRVNGNQESFCSGDLEVALGRRKKQKLRKRKRQFEGEGYAEINMRKKRKQQKMKVSKKIVHGVSQLEEEVGEISEASLYRKLVEYENLNSPVGQELEMLTDSDDDSLNRNTEGSSNNPFAKLLDKISVTTRFEDEENLSKISIKDPETTNSQTEIHYYHQLLKSKEPEDLTNFELKIQNTDLLNSPPSNNLHPQTSLQKESENSLNAFELLLNQKANEFEKSEKSLKLPSKSESQTDHDDSLAEIYECLQREYTKKIQNSPQKNPAKIRKKLSSKKKYSDIKPRLYEPRDQEKIRQEVIKKHNLQKEEETEPKTSHNTTRANRTYNPDTTKVEDRLLEYGKNRTKKILKKKISLKKKDLQKLKSNLTLKPALNDRTLELSSRIDRGNFDDIHKRLFYKGIESMKLREEKNQLEFAKKYPFVPNIEKNRKKVNEQIGPKEAEKMYQRFMKDEEIKNSKREIIKSFHENYDVETGQKLFKPKISKGDFRKKCKLDNVELKSQEYFVKDCEEFIKKCRQIFDFLDQDKEEMLYPRILNPSQMHERTVTLLSPILLQMISEDFRGNESMDFPMFYKMIRENELDDEVVKIFEVIKSQPLKRSFSRPTFKV